MATLRRPGLGGAGGGAWVMVQARLWSSRDIRSGDERRKWAWVSTQWDRFSTHEERQNVNTIME